MHHIRQRGFSPPLSILGKLMMYCSFDYSHISMTSCLPYLFNYRFLSSDFNCCTVLSIWTHICMLPYSLTILLFCTTSLAMQQHMQYLLSLFLTQDCRDVILNTNHGFTIVAIVRLDEGGDSYFGTSFWKEIAKFYVLKSGTKIALHIEGPGHEIYANFPDKIIRPDFVRSKFSFQLSAC